MNSTADWKPNFIDYWNRKGKIHQLAMLTAVQHQRALSEEMQRNSEAEAAHVRRSVWGETAANKSDDDVGTTILGDITVQAPQPPQAKSSVWPMVATAALGALLPTAGLGALAGYVLNAKPAAVTPEFDDETAKIGLGRMDEDVK